MMRADEIGRDVVPFTKVDELFNPFEIFLIASAV
jgi:hypothetical protein